ncbi:hypothetical protein HCN44_005329 [Aphidius gifuensis]|uniref:Uncharacterized protein n=1 Tax=Aphidius gifuensis TaxID=684658 RepID=A0A835CV36_APHGI|nr:hypothetical protein HCN44_005329 [Aphidius gifuensis]
MIETSVKDERYREYKIQLKNLERKNEKLDIEIKNEMSRDCLHWIYRIVNGILDFFGIAKYFESLLAPDAECLENKNANLKLFNDDKKHNNQKIQHIKESLEDFKSKTTASK